MRKLLTVFLGFVAVLFAGGCITDPVTGRTVIGAPISEAEESQMGIAYRPAIVAEYGGPYPDARLQSHLGGIVLGMTGRSARPDLPWTFTVVNTSDVNAFAVPGGQVFVTRGLLARLEDEAEFAVVMGHELGHVEHRHSVQQQGWQMIMGGAVSAVGAKWGDGAAQIAGLGAQIGVLLPHSRGDELESDVRGIENSYAAGYDPREGADVFRTFLKLKQESGGAGPSFLSTHPADEDRIRNILELCAQKDPRLAGTAPVAGLTVTTPAWRSLVDQVKREQRTYDRYDAAMKSIGAAGGSAASVRAALPEFQRCANELPGHAIFASTIGKALVALGDTGNARAWLERASSMNQELVEPEYLLGELALEARDWNGAARRAERGLAILPDNYPCLWVRGEASWNAGRRAEAERDLRAVLESAPAGSEQYKAAAARVGAPAAAPAKTPAKQPAKQPAKPARPPRGSRNR